MEGADSVSSSGRNFQPAVERRPDGTCGVCHWLGQCFDGDFCEATRFVAAELEKQPHKAAALPSMCRPHFHPQRHVASTGPSHWQSLIL